jgi:hypothetical protein
MYYDNPHAKRVVDLTAQLWLHIPISFETVKVEDLKPWIIGLRPCALAATRHWTKVPNLRKNKGLRCGKKLIEKLLGGFSKTNISP